MFKQNSILHSTIEPAENLQESVELSQEHSPVDNTRKNRATFVIKKDQNYDKIQLSDQ